MLAGNALSFVIILFNGFFGCAHANQSWPRLQKTEKDGETILKEYQVCLDCGTRLRSKIEFFKGVA